MECKIKNLYQENIKFIFLMVEQGEDKLKFLEKRWRYVHEIVNILGEIAKTHSTPTKYENLVDNHQQNISTSKLEVYKRLEIWKQIQGLAKSYPTMDSWKDFRQEDFESFDSEDSTNNNLPPNDWWEEMDITEQIVADIHTLPLWQEKSLEKYPPTNSLGWNFSW